MVEYNRFCQGTKKGVVLGLAHENSIEDGLLHYFGCLKFSEREAFLTALPQTAETKKLKLRISEEQARIAKLRNVLEAEGLNTENGKLLRSFQATLSGRFPRRRSYSHLKIPERAPASQDSTSKPKSLEDEVVLDDLKANVIYFNKRKPDQQHPGPYDHPNLEYKFPNQKVPLSLLLEDNPKENPLMWKCEENMIRYFHIPANNMNWVEEAIARYYNEVKPDLNGPYRKPEPGIEESKTRMLLRPQFWRGLQHGSRRDLPTHTRHMRPRCYPISTDHENTEPKPKNLVLFMPYLHWETDRRRLRSAEILKQHSPAKWSPFVNVVDDAREPVVETSMDRANSDGLLEHITTRTRARRLSSTPRKITHQSIQHQKLLGKLFLKAAALYEAMDSYTDEKLIEKYLNRRPPLHPRRTLDQSYYWTLKDTYSRDRDQVVYRGTAPSPKLLHNSCKKDDPKVKNKTCPQCTENVKKVPRVVMVDQLWMWILDENTIITSFPKRWGRNKPDPSAVQKCIRTRLRAARIDEVRSVYDLGIIILDQCSRVFFDRTQPTDLQPQVMDSFANAIGKVTHKQTIAFDHFWECTRLVSKGYNSRDETATASVKKWQDTLLDINPEGDLLREIKDILDELFIMTLIKTQEEAVIRTFVKNCQRIQNWTSPGDFSNTDNRSEKSSPRLGPYKSPRRTISLGQGPFINFDLQNDSEDVSWTMTCARELLDSLQDQLIELQALKNAAENTSLALKDLLALKQQQAGVVEARESVKQGEESLRQGRSIMLFTIVTIVFLPLSFFTGVFGMNAVELTGNGPYHWGDIFKFMIPISAVIITCSLLLAFSKLVRAFLSFCFNIFWAWLVTYTPAYITWRETHMNSKHLGEEEKKLVNKMKKKALKVAFERKEMERVKREEMEKERQKNPTSLQGRVGLVDGDIEMGVHH